MDNQEDTALLTAYIREWRKFFAQCGYLPLPFRPCDVMSKQRMASNNSWYPKKGNLIHLRTNDLRSTDTYPYVFISERGTRERLE